MSKYSLGRIEAIIAQLQSADDAGREEYLDHLRATEPELLVEVLRFMRDTGDSSLEDLGDRIREAVTPGTALIGRTIKQYTIEEVIGVGGMGVVYKAWDSKLKVNVALKFLPERLRSNVAARKRFMREAQAVARIDHRNICAIYSVDETEEGVPFLSMRLYEGETLRDRLSNGPLSKKEAESILRQTAAGLRAAHAKGLVHRDIKPENIFLTRGQEVKILDFGIAAGTDELSDTEYDDIAGTMAYMSPEQVKGRPATKLSDIWALGVVGYEIVTGRQPFEAEDGATTKERILAAQPMPLPSNVPRELHRLVAKCLQKVPAQRFSRARDVERFLSVAEKFPTVRRRFWMITSVSIIAALVLGWLVRDVLLNKPKVPPPQGPEVHVLAFSGGMDDSPMGRLAIGLAEDVLKKLRRVEGIDVREGLVGHQSLGDYVDDEGASLALELSLEDEPSIVLWARLFSARDRSVVWTQEFRPDSLNKQSIRDRIVSRVLAETHVDEKMRSGLLEGTEIPAAYEHYIRGLQIQKARLDFNSAINSFRDAIALDKEFASAHASLGHTLALKASTGYVYDEGSGTFEMARQISNRALELDPLNSSAHLAMGLILQNHEWKFDEATDVFETATQLSPSDPEAWHLLASNLAVTGHVDDAVEFQQRAIELSPSVPIYFANYLELLYLLNRPEDVLEEVEGAPPAIADYFFSFIWRAFAHMDLEEYAAAQQILDGAQEYFDDPNPLLLAMRARMHALMGNRQVAMELAERAEEKSPVLAASAYVILGEHERALRNLQIGFDRRDVYMTFLKVWPDANPLHDRQEFQQILRDMNLED